MIGFQRIYGILKERQLSSAKPLLENEWIKKVAEFMYAAGICDAHDLFDGIRKNRGLARRVNKMEQLGGLVCALGVKMKLAKQATFKDRQEFEEWRMDLEEDGYKVVSVVDPGTESFTLKIERTPLVPSGLKDPGGPFSGGNKR